MTKGTEFLETAPRIIPARVNIHHLQLRDLLQPSSTKDKVLFVSRLKVEQADFTSFKPPSVYCTLDFQPNCLTTGCGLLAAGGQHGELALRPLHSPLSAAGVSPGELNEDRPPAPWLLRTPTGGSINNAISLQCDQNYASSASSLVSASSHRHSKRDVRDNSTSPVRQSAPWYRDEPSTGRTQARPGVLFGDEEMESELSESVFQELAAAYGFDPSSVNRSSRWRRSSSSRQHLDSSSPSKSSTTVDPLIAPIKVMVSNNDQSVKIYKLRPPKSTPGAGGRIESGLPGLSRNTTLHFPTAINHSSLSPDQRILLAVGDTPEVFIYHVSRSGEHAKVATYSASSDACFSTTWSPDGTKFAVASQDGIVSVWDVRSSHKLATLSTSQASMTNGNGAARVVKFSPCGKFLAFTEHRNYFHITETVTFTDKQQILVPSMAYFSDPYPPSSGASVASLASERDNSSRWGDSLALEEYGSYLAPSGAGSTSGGTGGRRLIPLSGSSMLSDAGSDRFRVYPSAGPLISSLGSGSGTGVGGSSSEQALNRESRRRSLMHAAFLREWNRAMNQANPAPEGGSTQSTAGPPSTATFSATSNSNSSNGSSDLFLDTSWSDGVSSSASTTSGAAYDSSFYNNNIPSSLRSGLSSSSTAATGNAGATGLWRREDFPFRREEFSHRESSINISGMCWDPDGESIYVSTERLVARYSVLDARTSSSFGSFA